METSDCCDSERKAVRKRKRTRYEKRRGKCTGEKGFLSAKSDRHPKTNKGVDHCGIEGTTIRERAEKSSAARGQRIIDCSRRREKVIVMKRGKEKVLQQAPGEKIVFVIVCGFSSPCDAGVEG